MYLCVKLDLASGQRFAFVLLRHFSHHLTQLTTTIKPTHYTSPLQYLATCQERYKFWYVVLRLGDSEITNREN